MISHQVGTVNPDLTLANPKPRSEASNDCRDHITQHSRLGRCPRRLALAKELTAAAIARLRPTAARQEIRDGGCQGLHLVIHPTGSRSWILRTRRSDGRTAKITLGPVDLTGAAARAEPVIGAPLTLTGARLLATELHRQRAIKRQEAGPVFTEVAKSLVEQHSLMGGRQRQVRPKNRKRPKREQTSSSILERRMRIAWARGLRKKDRFIDRFGYTVDQLREHLERQFQDGMSWEIFGKGEIHIDHVLPVSMFDLSDEDERRACFSLANLQPLWSTDNLQKSAKRPDGAEERKRALIKAVWASRGGTNCPLGAVRDHPVQKSAALEPR